MLDRALRLMRIFHDKTQKDLASELEISKSHLSEIESGKKTPSLEILRRYSVVFEIPISSILFFVENLDDKPNLNKARGAIASRIITILEFIHDEDKDYKSEKDEKHKTLSS